MDITKIPTSEMLRDLAETNKDIYLCEFALNLDIATYGHNRSISYRLDKNREIKAIIEAELQKRAR